MKNYHTSVEHSFRRHASENSMLPFLQILSRSPSSNLQKTILIKIVQNWLVGRTGVHWGLLNELEMLEMEKMHFTLHSMSRTIPMPIPIL